VPKYRPKKQREPLVFPPVPPLDEILDRRGELDAFLTRAQDRDASRIHNDRESRAAVVVEIKYLPPTPTEYVLNYGDDGKVIGVKPAR
jgi:hypothetical protein